MELKTEDYPRGISRANRCSRCVCPKNMVEQQMNDKMNCWEEFEGGVWNCYMNPDLGACKGASVIINKIKNSPERCLSIKN